MSLKDLLKQRIELDAQIGAAQAESKAAAMAEVKYIMAECDISLADLGKATKSAKAPVAAKYRNSKGETWAGRGKRPVWLQTALAAGAKLEEYAVA